MKKEINEELLKLSENNPEGLKCSFEIAETSADTVIIKPVGSINSYNAVYFQNKMEKLIDTGFKYLVFDMRNTKYVSAVGIGSFIHILERLKVNGGAITLNGMQNQVIEVFQLPGFAEYFDINLNTRSAVLDGNKRKVAIG